MHLSRCPAGGPGPHTSGLRTGATGAPDQQHGAAAADVIGLRQDMLLLSTCRWCSHPGRRRLFVEDSLIHVLVTSDSDVVLSKQRCEYEWCGQPIGHSLQGVNS